MTVCATCSRELQPSWKYCIYCGTRTTVPLTAAIDVITPEERAELVEPAEYDNTDTGVLKIEDIPSDEADAITSLTPNPVTAEPKINVLAIIALILGCLLSPLAALFGHIALTQISRSGERGTAIAWVAIVLGYLSLAALLVIGISYLVLNT